MLNRSERRSESDWTRSLKQALRAGVEAMHDQYFRDNPNYSRDAVHVAAIACRCVLERGEAKAENLKVARGVRP